jgi:DNA-binding Xre family transcriptional regulator
MEIVSLAVEGGSFMAERLPRFIARRVFKVEKLTQQIDLSLRSQTPVALVGVPKVLSIWFTLVNQSSLDLRIESMAVEVWFGQPIAMISHIVPVMVPRRSKATDLRAAIVLSEDLAHHARRTAETPSGSMHVYATMMCHTSVFDFVLTQRFEREARDTRFDGPPLVTQ